MVSGRVPSEVVHGLARRARRLDPARRVAQVKAHLRRFEEHIAHVEKCFSNLDERLTRAEQRFTNLDLAVNHTQFQLDEVRNGVAHLQETFASTRPVGLHEQLGLRLLLERGAAVDGTLAAGEMWEPEQIAFLTGIIDHLVAERQDPHFLDLGAYWGLYSLLAAQHGVRTIHAFEPERHNRAQLCAQLFLNDVTDIVTVHGVALSDRAGTVNFMDSRKSPDHNRGGCGILWRASQDHPHYQVDAVALDEYLPLSERTLVMKLDLEGAESHALAGMRRTIEQNRVVMQVEVFPQHRDEIGEALQELPLRHVHTIGVDRYYTNLSDAELGLATATATHPEPPRPRADVAPRPSPAVTSPSP